MGLALQTAADPAVVGFDAGWSIELRKEDTAHKPVGQPLTVSRNDYFGEIKVDTSATFRGGTFEVTLDGLSDKHFGEIVSGSYVFMLIKLGWRDRGSGALAPFKDVGAFLTGGSGPDSHYTDVLHGRIRSCERTAGDFRYRTKFTGVDYNWELLRCTEVTHPLAVSEGDPARTYAEALCRQAGVPITTHPVGEAGEPIDSLITIPREAKVSAALSQVARAAHGEGADRRIPMFLRTDGLHFGPWLAPAVMDTSTHRLELKSGLVETKPVVEPNPEACNPNMFLPPTILRYDLTLRGRADIQVGDKVDVNVDVPSPGPSGSDFGALIGGLGDVIQGVGEMFGADPEPRYSPFRVISVKHELDRTKGFTTTLRVESQPDDEEVTDRSELVGRAGTATIDEAARTAAALAVQANERRREVELLDIGEVNAQHVQAGTSGNHSVAAQRIDIQEGLVRDGQGNSTVRLDRAETPTQLFNKPYLTPFAFGSTGLVIPHYPGVRVANLHYRDDVSQSMVAGCLWRDDNEPASHLGDWWLSLPTGVSAAQSVEDSREANLPEGPASHDLIDKDGNRAIHVRGLRICVGQGKMPDVGVRPDDPAPDEVLIEHKSGATFHIDTDGNITIHTSKDIRFEANKITMQVQDSVEVT